MTPMKQMLTLLSASLLLAVAACSAPETGAPDTAPQAEAAPEKVEAPKGEATLSPRARIETTLGDIVVALNGEKAPLSVSNFVRYAEEGFYEGTIFHRVMSNFMIQGGGLTPDLDKKGKGLYAGIQNEWRNGLKNKRGTIAMARLGGQPDSATAQFFINVVDNASLDRPQRDGAAYAVFGKVVEGMDVVDAIRNTKVQNHPKYGGGRAKVVPVETIVIEKVELIDEFDRETFDARVARIRAEQEALEAEALKQKREAAKREAEASPVGRKRAADLKSVVEALEAEHDRQFTTTPSGLMYMAIRQGSGPSPTAADKVNVHYRGTFLNGEEFDSSYKRGEPISFPLSGVIKGWTEGVAMMQVGGKSMLICPPDLAYGSRGRPGMPANSTLVFQVELLGIE